MVRLGERQSVLNGVLAYTVDSGVLMSNAMRQVRSVTSTAPRTGQRDHTRAMPRPERDRVVRGTYDAAQKPAWTPDPDGSEQRRQIWLPSWPYRSPFQGAG
jgi:hypothetical protein